jgi:undecaprenyl-diphosphatase
MDILISLLRYKTSSVGEKNVLHFLIISTFVSGVLGFVLLLGLEQFESELEVSGKTLTAIVGLLLLFTAWLQLKKKNATERLAEDVGIKDSLLLGLAQGLTVLPGLSRSGLTVSALLLRKVDDESALKLSFLMSLPIVLVGNIVLNIDMFITLADVSSVALWGLLASFAFGLATIHLLIKLSRKVNFGYFVGIFGILMIFSTIV